MSAAPLECARRVRTAEKLALRTSSRAPQLQEVPGKKGCRSGSERPTLSFIIQFFRHPQQLRVICGRLCDPRVEIVVHADSSTAEDKAALRHVEREFGAVIVRSDNIHEIRGYNLAASIATGRLLAFSQDDRIPPARMSWLEPVLLAFHRHALPELGALGLHRGSERVWSKGRMPMIGLCGDADDDTDGHKWNALYSRAMTDPLRYVSFLNLGPIVVRKRAFDAVGGFNESYSRPGQMGIGFDHELTTRLWTRGWHSAVLCPSRSTAFRNGCGGKGSAVNMTLRKQLAEANRMRYLTQFTALVEPIEAAVRKAQSRLLKSPKLLEQLRHALPNCVDCERAPLVKRSLGFGDRQSCPMAHMKMIQYEDR